MSSRKHNINGALNRAFNELSMVRAHTDDGGLTQDDYIRLGDIFKVAGRIRQSYLEMQEKNEELIPYA